MSEEIPQGVLPVRAEQLEAQVDQANATFSDVALSDDGTPLQAGDYAAQSADEQFQEQPYGDATNEYSQDTEQSHESGVDRLVERFDRLWQDLGELSAASKIPTTAELRDSLLKTPTPNTLVYRPTKSTERYGEYEALPYLLPTFKRNRSSSEEFDGAWQNYTDGIAQVRAEGSLDAATVKKLKMQFRAAENVGTGYSTRDIESYSEEKLSRALYYNFDNGTEGDVDQTRRFDFTSAIQQFGLDQQAADRLTKLAEDALYVSEHQKEGSNFAYSYSKPFVRFGIDSQGGVRAELGLSVHHRNTSFGDDNSWTRFEGVPVPAEGALAFASGGLDVFKAAVNAEKQAAEAVDTEAVKQELYDAADAVSAQFVELFKQGAAEFSDLSDEQLLSLLELSAKGGDDVELSPRERSIVKMMHDPDMKQEIVCTEGGRMLSDDELGSMRFGHHYRMSFDLVTANGRTGKVSVTHYRGSPRDWKSSKGGVEYQDDMTPQQVVELRQRILTANLA